MKSVVGINYVERGKGDTPIICMHGIGGNVDSFSPQLSGLSDRHRVIAWNMPGFGGSDPLIDTAFPALAAKLRDFLQALGIRRAHLVGQSIGGMVAMEMASLHPEFVETLVLIGTTSAFGGPDDSFKDKFVAARLKPLDAGEKIADLAVKFVPEIVGPIATPDVIEAAIASMAAVPEATYRDIIQCLVTFNRRSDIAGFQMPCCLIAGEVDQNAPARTMAKMAGKIPGAQFHEIKGAGHLVNLEAGRATNAIMTKFYESYGA